MKATPQRRLTLLVGLLLLSLLVFAIGAQVAQAMLRHWERERGGRARHYLSGRDGGGQGWRRARTSVRPPQPSLTPAAGRRSAGRVARLAASGPPARSGLAGQGWHLQLAASDPRSVTQPASSGTSSTTYWLIGSAVAVLIAGIGAWALLRRRRQPAESASAAYCARHPEDSLCGAA